MNKVVVFRTRGRVSQYTKDRLNGLFSEMTIVKDGVSTEFQYPHGISANECHHLQLIVQHLIAWDAEEESIRSE